MKRASIKGLIILAALAVLTGFTYTLVKMVTPDTQPSVVEKVEKNVTVPPTVEALLTRVNAERSKAGVSPLIIDQRLNRSAQQKADDMLVNNYNGHIDKNGRHGYDIAHEFAPDICNSPSENLYWGDTSEYPSTTDGAVSWWMSSKAHHDAMLNSKYTYTGFGIAGTKIVEHFC